MSNACAKSTVGASDDNKVMSGCHSGGREVFVGQLWSELENEHPFCPEFTLKCSTGEGHGERI